MLARVVPDHAAATRRAIGEALEGADVVLLSGGVSVGPHDHVKPALADLGVEERFWRVALRPGKPTWFGARGRTLVFGLPGNPVSAMVTFLLFARPALAALQWAEPPAAGRAILGERLLCHPDRDECVRVRLEDGTAYATGPQGSHVLLSMALADGLVVVPRGDGPGAGGGHRGRAARGVALRGLEVGDDAVGQRRQARCGLLERHRAVGEQRSRSAP